MTFTPHVRGGVAVLPCERNTLVVNGAQLIRRSAIQKPSNVRRWNS
jgi:hypothetical protein